MRDLSFCRQQFPSLARTIGPYDAAYLDSPAGTQVPASVIAAISDYYMHHNANTHGQFGTTAETDRIIEQAREDIAALLGSESGNTISFGANMTTLNFALARAIGRTLKPGDEIVVTDLDHDANVAPWLTLAEQGVVIRQVGVKPDATLDYEDFTAKVTERTRLIAVGLASNAVGTVNDMAFARAEADRVGAQLLIDAVHYAPHGPIDVQALGCDYLLCSVYKFFGPHIGVLYARPGLLERLQTDRVRPQLATAPERIETGTLNHAALAGTSAAVSFIASLAAGGDSLRDRLTHAMQDVYDYEHAIGRRLYEGLCAIQGVRVYGPPFADALRAPTVSFTLQGQHPTDICRHLGQHGLFTWDGDFYAMTIIERLGLAQAGGVVRVGLAPYNTLQEVERLLSVVDGLARA